MNKNPKITIIGAASTTFGPKVLRDILNHPRLWGSTYNFVDVNEERLEVYDKLARKTNEIIKKPNSIKSTTDRRQALPDSDYVIISVDTGHYKTWEKDFTIPNNNGYRQVQGELGGPGGLFHSLRQIPIHLEIVRDIEELCPDAMVMVLSNPLNRICYALEKYSKKGQIVGLCHGVEMALYLYLNRVLDIDGDDMYVTAAGTNHFTWILDYRRKSTGEDLYPYLKKSLSKIESGEQPLSRKLLEIYGYFPACLDDHFGEYLPFAHGFMKDIDLDFKTRLDQEEKRWEYLKDLSDNNAQWDNYQEYLNDQSVFSEELRLDDFFAPRSWADTLAFPIINAIKTNELHRMPAVDLVNNGTISNLPDDVFVETPAVVDSSGIQPVRIGEMPQPLAAFCRRDVDQMRLTVEAAVKGDRNLVLQAMLLDPTVNSISSAEIVLDKMLKENSQYLPQF